MARNISQIYAEAIATRNDYLQITELDSGRTGSKMSILNLITYVMAVLIYSYETILDIFQINVATIISNRINGTAPYYATIAKLFQFNPISQTGDPMVFDEELYKIEYETVNEEHRIIAQASYENFNQGDAIILKVCKESTDSNDTDNGTLYTQLSDAELTAFKQYIANVKFCGATIYCTSNPGDIIYVHTSSVAPIYFDNTLVTEGQALQNIKTSLAEYAKSFEYDSYISYQKIIDVIQNTTGITDISSNVTVGVLLYNDEKGVYNDEVTVTGRIRSGSGYLKFIDEDEESTLNDLVLISESQRHEMLTNATSIDTTELNETSWEKTDGQWVKVVEDQSSVLSNKVYTQKRIVNIKKRT